MLNFEYKLSHQGFSIAMSERKIFLSSTPSTRICHIDLLHQVNVYSTGITKMSEISVVNEMWNTRY